MRFAAVKQDGMLCYCMGIRTHVVMDAIKAGHTSLKAIKAETTACTGSKCATMNPSGKCCSKEIRALIALYGGVVDLQPCHCC